MKVQFSKKYAYKNTNFEIIAAGNDFEEMLDNATFICVEYDMGISLSEIAIPEHMQDIIVQDMNASFAEAFEHATDSYQDR